MTGRLNTKPDLGTQEREEMGVKKGKGSVFLGKYKKQSLVFLPFQASVTPFILMFDN